MNVLLIGSGGREHALACVWPIPHGQTPSLSPPGNAGTADVAENVPWIP